jgi:hypothetical protein
MAGHKRETAKHVYGQTDADMGPLSANTMQTFKRFCRKYQGLFGLLADAYTDGSRETPRFEGDRAPEHGGTVPHANNVPSSSLEEACAAAFRRSLTDGTFGEALTHALAKGPARVGAATLERRPPPVPNARRAGELLNYLSDFIPNQPGVRPRFSSKNQATLMEAMMNPTEDLLAFLRVGSGKSTLISAVASARSDKLFVVVVFFRALINNLMERARAQHVHRVDCWAGGAPSDGDSFGRATGLLFVMGHQAVEQSFLAFLTRQVNYGTLSLILVEEAHVPLCSFTFRREMVHLRALRRVPVPMFLLTGTAPYGSVDVFEGWFGCRDVLLLRDNSNRANLTYEVSARSMLDRFATLPPLHQACIWRHSTLA